jgi:hypothetical protein
MLENLVHFRQCERVWAFQFGQAAVPKPRARRRRAFRRSPLMAQVVSNLDQDDMLAIVAYLASLDP